MRDFDDHIHALRLAAEKSREWGATVWACSWDIESTFDRMFHPPMFESLVEAGLSEEIVALLTEIIHDLSIMR